MYAPPMPLEQPPMVDRPGVRALRGARPQMTPEMQRMRDWANSQRTATAANARNGDFILNPVGSGSAPMGVGIPTQMPTGDWRSAAPSKPSGWVSREDGPGILRLDHALRGWVSREDGTGKPGMPGGGGIGLPSMPGGGGIGLPSMPGGGGIGLPSMPGGGGIGLPSMPGGGGSMPGGGGIGLPSMPGGGGIGLPGAVKPGMEPPPPDKGRRLTGRRG